MGYKQSTFLNNTQIKEAWDDTSLFISQEFLEKDQDVLIQQLYEAVRAAYERKSRSIQERVFPVIKNVYENQSESFENIVIPFTDGRKAIKIVANLKEAYESEGKKAINALETDINALAGGPAAGPGPAKAAGADAAAKDASARGLNPAAKAFVPGQKGGYTYGRSRKRGKGRRKRGKKSRRKGSHKGKR